MENGTYRLDPAAFRLIRKQMLLWIRVTPLLLAGVWFLDGRLQPHRDLFDFVLLPLIVAYGAWQIVQREQQKWGALRLEIHQDRVLRVIPGYPLLEINQGEITSIIESSKGLFIKTASRQKALFVSSGLL